MRILTTLAALIWAAPCFSDAVLLSETAIPLEQTAELSAIDLRDDGATFVMVTDRGVAFEGTINRAGDTVTGLTITQQAALLDEAGNPLKNRLTDAEGISFAPSGGFHVSFENWGRVWYYPSITSAAQPVRIFDAFQTFQPNAGLEALATGADGTIYTIPERSGRYDEPFPVYRYSSDWDVAFFIPRTDSFLITGADFGPDGLLYVLERDFLGIGFRSRVRRFDMNGNGETVMQSAFGTHSNLEGIAVWQDDTGATRLTMVSDNGQTFLPTMIVEYRLLD